MGEQEGRIDLVGLDLSESAQEREDQVPQITWFILWLFIFYLSEWRFFIFMRAKQGTTNPD